MQGSLDNNRRKQDALDGYNILKQNGIYTEYFLVEGGGYGLEQKANVCAEKTIDFIKRVLKLNN